MANIATGLYTLGRSMGRAGFLQPVAFIRKALTGQATRDALRKAVTSKTGKRLIGGSAVIGGAAGIYAAYEKILENANQAAMDESSVAQLELMQAAIDVLCSDDPCYDMDDHLRSLRDLQHKQLLGLMMMGVCDNTYQSLRNLMMRYPDPCVFYIHAKSANAEVVTAYHLSREILNATVGAYDAATTDPNGSSDSSEEETPDGQQPSTQTGPQSGEGPSSSTR